MDDRIPGGGTADHESTTDDTRDWTDLVTGLSAQLLRMTDERDHLVIELPDGHDGETTPYAQFSGLGDDLLRAELGGDAYLAPTYMLSDEWSQTLRLMGWQGNDDEELNWFVERPVRHAKVIAALVIAALRDTYGVAHPHLLTYRAWGPAADGAADLGLRETGQIPAELPEPEDMAEAPGQPMVLMPADRDDLVEMVLMTLHAKLGERPPVDDDGDVVLQHLGQPMWVRVRPDQPAVEIVARVTHGIYSRRATAAELALLNRDRLWVKWTLQERAVWQHLLIPGMPFVPAHLDAMLDVFLEAMADTRDDLAYRVGGRVA